MTSDTTDSLRWAEATYESGRLISKEFNYAAILPFGGNLIFLPFVAMFGYSLTAQICGLVLFTLLLISALWYLARGIGLDRLSSAALTALFLLIMSSSPKLREIMWEHIFYYNLGVLFFCIGFGLAARILRDGGIIGGPGRGRLRDRINIALLLIFSALASLNGLQSIVCLTLPLAFALFTERFLDARIKLLSRGTVMTAGLSVLILVASATGIFLLSKFVSTDIRANYAENYSTWSGINDWPANLLRIMSNWFTLLGVDEIQGPVGKRFVSFTYHPYCGGTLLLCGGTSFQIQ